MKTALSINQILKDSWVIIKKNASFIYGVGFLTLLVNATIQSISRSYERGKFDDPLAVGVQLASTVISLAISIGWIISTLKMVRQKEPLLKDFMPDWKKLLLFFVTGILYGAIIVAGLILLIVPGIIWAIKYMYAPTLIIDKNLGPFEALKASAQMTEGIKWQLVAFAWVYFGVALLGVLALGVGLLVAVPLISISSYTVYNILLPKIKKSS